MSKTYFENKLGLTVSLWRYVMASRQRANRPPGAQRHYIDYY